jgi:endoglucanase
MKRIVSLLLVLAFAIGFMPAVATPAQAETEKTVISSLTYNFLADGVDAPTELTFAVLGFGGYPRRATTTSLSADGEVSFSLTGVSLGGMGVPGFVEVIAGSAITLELTSIVVNGGFTLLPNEEVVPSVLTVGAEGSNSFPNQWGGAVPGSKLAVSADEDSYLQFVTGEGWVFIAGKADPIEQIMKTSRSIDYARAMGNGWNLGNTLDGFLADGNYSTRDVAGWETAWGNPQATRELIESIKERGFDHIRIPFSVISRGVDHGADTPADEIRFEIYEEWLARYLEVVQWAVDAGLYVMINIHHDSWFWLGRDHRDNPMSPGWNGNEDEAHFRRFTDYWKQLAELFADMPDEVMFETINEPEYNANDPAFNVTASENHRRNDVINKAAYDIIRATPGNEERMIIIPTYKTNHGSQHSAPTRDFIADLEDENIIATVHYYSEWVFSQHLGRLLFDEPLFNQYDAAETASARDSADDFFDIIYTYFISRGIGVSIGEWGLLGYDGDTDASGSNAIQRGEELKYYEYIQHLARQTDGVSLSFWDNGSGIDRRCEDLSWKVPKVGEMLLSTERSAYTTGLDTVYLPAGTPPSEDLEIPLTLNGNTFLGIRGLVAGRDFVYESGTVRLLNSYLNSVWWRFNQPYGVVTTLELRFDGGINWEVKLVKNAPPHSEEVSGTRNGIIIPISYNGNHIYRISAFRGQAPEVLTGLLDENWVVREFPQGIRVGGNHTEWWPYLEYGNAYSINYAGGTLTLHRGFFSGTVQNGANVVVIEFLDGSRLDITLDVQGNTVRARPAVSSSFQIRKGAVINGRTITINDALEVLKFLAKLDSTLTAGSDVLSPSEAMSAARITVESGNPTINCALEILKHLAKLITLP